MLKDGQTYINHFEVLTPQDFKGMCGHFFNIRHETVKPRNSIETQPGKFFFKRMHEDHDFIVLWLILDNSEKTCLSICV